MSRDFLLLLSSLAKVGGLCFPNKAIVGCWQNIFSEDSRASLVLAGEARSHSFTSVFDRREEPRSALENALISLLNELSSDNEQDFFVEYWWRDSSQIRMLEAHRDVDEMLCQKVQLPISLGSGDKIGRQRCPDFGHVLYLEVSPNVRAPTLIWEESTCGPGAPRVPLEKLWAVPASSNRLLRFHGDALHAVCYPPLDFLDVAKKETKLNSEVGETRRAVLLFNTWKEPPTYPPAKEPLSPAELDSFSKDACLSRPKGKWEKVYSVGASNELANECNTCLLTVPLLGDFSRRGCYEASLQSKVIQTDVIKALTSQSTIHGLALFPILGKGDDHI